MWATLPEAIAWHLSSQARTAAIESLSHAKTLEECKAELKLGTWLQMRDGSWIAIRYQDCHGPLWSVAIAKDSSGNWYESREHFCGMWGSYGGLRENLAHEVAVLQQENKPVPQGLVDQLEGLPLHEIEDSPDLATALPLFLKLGFTPMPHP